MSKEDRIALAVSGDMASVNRIKADNGDNISHLATPAEIRLICMHLVKDGAPLRLISKDRELELYYPDNMNDIRWCITYPCEIVEPFRVKTGWNTKSAKLFACDCAEHVLHLFEKRYPFEPKPRQALDIARAYVSHPERKAELSNVWEHLCKLSFPYSAAHCALDAVISATTPRLGFVSVHDAAHCALEAISGAVSEVYYGHIVSMIDGTPPPRWDTCNEEASMRVHEEKRWQNQRILMYLLGDDVI